MKLIGLMTLAITALLLTSAWSWPKPSAPIAAASAIPSQCAGMTFDNVIDKPTKIGSFTGTAGRDFIIVRGGTVRGEGGDDCILVAKGSIVYGGAGDDVLIYTGSSTSGIVKGDYNFTPYPVGYTSDPVGCDPDLGDDPCTVTLIYGVEGFDRCIGKWSLRETCEATN